jgi:3-oxoacyl-[acyl-carrier-protein] synthase III
MCAPQKVYLAGAGSFLPGAPIPWDQADRVLGELVDAPAPLRRWLATTKPLMRELLGIETVHYAIDPVTREFTEDNITMAAKAAKAALAEAGVTPADVDLLCYGAAHMDQMPTPSARLQEALGIPFCTEFAIHANCTSAYKALYLAWSLLRAGGPYRTAVVASASMASSELRAEYYNQAKLDKESLFLRWFQCDGAGALVLTTDPARSRGFEVEQVHLESMAGTKPSLMFNQRPAYWMNPAQEYAEARHHLRQQFRNALASETFVEKDGSVFVKGLRRMLVAGDIGVETIRHFQVNLPARHIAEAIMEECGQLGLRPEVFYSRLDTLGYCGPPMALICIDTLLREHRCQSGERIASFVTEVSKFMQAGFCLRYGGG